MCLILCIVLDVHKENTTNFNRYYYLYAVHLAINSDNIIELYKIKKYLTVVTRSYIEQIRYQKKSKFLSL